MSLFLSLCFSAELLAGFRRLRFGSRTKGTTCMIPSLVLLAVVFLSLIAFDVIQFGYEEKRLVIAVDFGRFHRPRSKPHDRSR
jgi:hypothetical protein